jgi:3-hydroxyacyl-CoA dehydrogenase/enoyl-CoA hydratase/3-hydroxybutyryl-CoA epimerase/enoyl-CoA isomerase
MIFKGDALHCDWIEPGLAELCFDAAGSVNKFDRATLAEFRQAVDALKAEKDLKGVLVSSAKSVFIVGADITEFQTLFAAPEDQLRTWLREANAIFNDFEDLPVPTIAAVNGVALGGGMEMCLACDLRVAAQSAQVGLPETKLGLIPGFGGTTRLPRLIGADNALEWIAGGSSYRPMDALKVGAVDAVVPDDKLRDAALLMLREAIAGELDWQRRRADKKGPLHLNATEAAMAFSTARAYIYGKAGKHYPAPFAAVDVMEKAASMARDEALVVEAEGFIKVARTEVASSLISIFLNDQMLKKQAKAAASAARPVGRVGVLGAGIMGGGIAFQAAVKGMPVVMKDIRQEALELGLNEASKLLNKQLERGKLNPEKMAQTLNRIVPTLHYTEVGDADVVIEAVVENPKVKESVLAETEAVLAEDAILCSNTSTISISRLAKVLKRPEKFCGMHFFNPVHRMPLVEVIRGEKTSEETISQVVALASAMGKSPIIVNDCPGFFVNRVLFPYFKAFNLLLKDGADFRRIDKVMEGFGWPMGPAYLLDVVGIDTGHHAAAVLAEGFPDRMANDFRSALDVLYEAERFGQKNGKGFYAYQPDKKGKPKKQVDESVFELLKPVCAEPRDFSDEEIVHRMMLPMIIETIRCIEEKIVGTVAEADLGLIYGLGFPPFRGGALKYTDSLGLPTVVELADKYASLGKLYEPTEGMRQMAAEGRTFYTKH